MLHKLCAGPCDTLKPVTAFYRATARLGGYRSWCKSCSAPYQRARLQKLAASGYYTSDAYRAKEKTRKRTVKRPQPQPLEPCVYIVQVLGRAQTVKIGKTTRTVGKRLAGLRQQYGALTLLFVLPTEQPHALERQLHAQFHPFRLYDGAKQTELFQLRTKAAQKALQGLYTHYPDAVRSHPTWQDEQAETDEHVGQLAFW